MHLKIEVDYQDFMRFYGDERLVAAFSPQARELIFNKTVALQQKHKDGTTHIDWSDNYCHASELDDREVWANNNEIIENNARDLFDIAASHKNIYDKLDLGADEDDTRYDIDIVKDNEDYLLEQEGFRKEAIAFILSKLSDGFDALENGKWLIYGY
ncbi:MAG: hypothetical protein J6N72_11180 [Psychrobacter sp.]|nr:hypothetical protein [Psychrobacter sp.]